jgi:hypothetical protein
MTALAAAALSRPLDGVRSTSQVLAWRLHQHLQNTPAPAQPASVDAWRALAWTLKAAENRGLPADLLLAPVKAGSDIDGIRQQIHAYTRPQPATGALPWLTAIPTASHTAYDQYLRDAGALIEQRVHEVTARAIEDQPAWLAGLSTAPATAFDDAGWRRHVGVVAAYRDQHQVTTDDPALPLGAYQAADSSGHRAYLHAANAVLAARHPQTAPADPATTRVAADIHLALSDTDRDAITRAVAHHLGDDWLGPRNGAADMLITAPVYATELANELARRGHLRLAPADAATKLPAARRTLEVRQPQVEPAPGTPLPQPGINITW